MASFHVCVCNVWSVLQTQKRHSKSPRGRAPVIIPPRGAPSLEAALLNQVKQEVLEHTDGRIWGFHVGEVEWHVGSSLRDLQACLERLSVVELQTVYPMDLDRWGMLKSDA